MAVAPAERARHIKNRIRSIRTMLRGATFENAKGDPVIWPALERHLEVISEASRKLPEAWTAEFGPDIAWRQIAAIGNVLRHVYETLDPGVLWSIYENDLDPLEAAIDRMLAAHPADED